MLRFKFTRKKIIFLTSTILIIFIINSIFSSVIENKISEFLLKNESKYYTAHVESSHFRLLRRSLVLNNLSLTPNQESLDSLMHNDSAKQALERITLSSVKFNGIGLINILFNDKIYIKTLEINDLHIIKIQNAENTKIDKQRKALNLDSIYIKKLKGFQIDKIAVNDFVYETVDIESNEITFKNEPLNFVSSGFKLEEFDSQLFKLLPVKESFEISKIELNINALKYDFSVENIAINFTKKLIAIEKLRLKPQISKRKLALSYPFSKDVFDVEIEAFKIHNFNLTKLLNKEGIFIDSVYVSGLDLGLYKDKRRPFNKNKHKTLPHIALQNSKTPIYIAKINVEKSNVLIEEHLEKRDTLLVISLDSINAKIQNITSIKALSEQPMLVDVTATLMKKAALKVHINFPLKHHVQDFSFNGTLGAANLKLFDSALFPAIGLKVLDGRLISMVFDATANDDFSNGSMTMRYQGLEAKVFKANSLEKSKFLSWSVNTLIKKSNPTKKKKARVAVIEFERAKYKGIGNYLWKSLLSGIANSIVPGGKQVKPTNKRNK